MLINKSFISNISFGWIKTIFVIIYQFLLILLTLKFSNHKIYGEFVIANQLGNYLLLFTSSINLGMVKVLIDYKKSKNYYNYLGYLLSIFLKISVLIILITFFLAFLIEHFTNYNLIYLIIFSGLNTSVLVLTLFYEAIHKANEHHKKYYVRFCCSLIIRIIFILTLFKLYNFSETLLLIMLISNLFYLYLLGLDIPTKKIFNSYFLKTDKSNFKKSVFAHSGHSFLRIIIDQSTRFLYIIFPAFLFGAEASSFLEISSKIGQSVYSMFSSINSVFLSRYNSFLNLLPSKENLRINNFLVLNFLKNLSYGVFAIIFFLLPHLLSIWLGNVEPKILSYSYLFLIYFLLKSGLDIQIPIIVSLDKIKSLSYSFIFSFLIQFFIPLISIKFLKDYNLINHILILSLSVGIIFRNVFLFPKISRIVVMSEFEKILIILYVIFYFFSIINNNLYVIGIINSLLLIYVLISFKIDYEKQFKNFVVGSKQHNN